MGAIEPYRDLDSLGTFGVAKIVKGKDSGSLEKNLFSFYSNEMVLKPVSYFERFAKKEGDFSDYWIARNFGSGYLDEDVEKYFDSKLGLILGNGSDIGAICSFEPFRDAFLVNQIQGYSNKSGVTSYLRYPDLFLDLVYEFARENDVSEVWTLPYSRNKYKIVQDNFQNTKKRQYDIPAVRSGAIYDEEMQVFRKKLK